MILLQENIDQRIMCKTLFYCAIQHYCEYNLHKTVPEWWICKYIKEVDTQPRDREKTKGTMNYRLYSIESARLLLYIYIYIAQSQKR